MLYIQIILFDNLPVPAGVFNNAGEVGVVGNTNFIPSLPWNDSTKVPKITGLRRPGWPSTAEVRTTVSSLRRKIPIASLAPPSRYVALAAKGALLMRRNAWRAASPGRKDL